MADITELMHNHYMNIQDSFVSGRDASRFGTITNQQTYNLSGGAYLDDNDVFHYPSGKNLIDNPQDLYNMINYHKSILSPAYFVKNNYYKGRHINIMNKPATQIGDPDNRVVVNFPKKLVDTFNGYFIGTPVKIDYTSQDNPSQDDVANKFIKNFEENNYFDDVLTEASKWSSIFGRSYLYEYNDQQARAHVVSLKPTDTFIIYDDTVANNPIYGVHYIFSKGSNNNTTMTGFIATAKDIINFSSGAEDVSNVSFDFNPDDSGIDDNTAHPLDTLPMVEIMDNSERLGVFDDVISLIDAVDGAVSQKMNDIDYFAQAILAIWGVKLSKEDLQTVKSHRVLNLFPNITDPNNYPVNYPQPNANFLERPTDDQTQENALDRNIDLIYQISQIANLNDVQFNTAAAQALDFKIHSMKTKALNKETKMTRALNEIFEAVFESSGMSNYDWQNLNYTFTQTVPHDLASEADGANKMANVTSLKTALGTLSNVDDPNAEMEQIQKEKEQNMQDFANGNADPYSGNTPSNTDGEQGIDGGGNGQQSKNQDGNIQSGDDE